MLTSSLSSMFRKSINFFLYDVRKEEYGAAIKFLRDRNKILDVGCGTGTFMEAIKGLNIHSKHRGNRYKSGEY